MKTKRTRGIIIYPEPLLNSDSNLVELQVACVNLKWNTEKLNGVVFLGVPFLSSIFSRNILKISFLTLARAVCEAQDFLSLTWSRFGFCLLLHLQLRSPFLFLVSPITSTHTLCITPTFGCHATTQTSPSSQHSYFRIWVFVQHPLHLLLRSHHETALMSCR